MNYNQNFIFNPISINKYNIYDIFYNDNGEYIIMCPFLDKKKLNIKIKINDVFYNFNYTACPHNHTKVYHTKAPKTDNNVILLNINNENISLNINNYPSFNNEIIMSTMVKNEDNYIKQWINYHSKLGVNRFIIYDNAGINDGASYNSNQKTSNLEITLKDYIEDKKVVLIKWPYKKRFPKNSISGQTTQQNHSIYLFKNSKYIGLFDIDEYLNPKKKIENIDIYFNSLIKKDNINIDKISCLRFKNKFFYNPHNKNVSGTNFLNIFNCDNITNKGRTKCFVRPKNVKIYAIHNVLLGLPKYTVHHNLGHFNHYFYLNKNNRGKKKTGLIDKSILNNI